MGDDRSVKALLHAELANGSLPVGRPQLKFKDTCNSALKCGGVLSGEMWLTSVKNGDSLFTRLSVSTQRVLKRVKETD